MNGYVFNKSDENLDNETKEITKFLKFLINKEDLGNAEVNVVIVNSDEIHELNKNYRNIDKETDVLSFALEENESFVDPENRVLGDIYISIDVAKKQCIDFDNNVLDELLFLTVHGFLHLLGYDHMEEEDYKKMFKKQEMLLNEYKESE